MTGQLNVLKTYFYSKWCVYNSYFIDDEKTCVVDSVDAEIREEFLRNLIQWS